MGLIKNTSLRSSWRWSRLLLFPGALCANLAFMWNLVQVRCSGEAPRVLIGSQLVWLLFKTSEVFRWLEKHFYQMVLNWLTSVSHVNIHRTKNKICLGNVWILSIKKFCDICTSEVCWYCFQCDQQCFLTWRFLQFLPVILTFFVFCESLTLNLMTTQGALGNEDLAWE